MIDKTLYDNYAAALSVNADLLQQAILALDTELSSLSGKSLQAALAARYAALAKIYGATAAQCAVEFYTRLRSGADVMTEYAATQADGKTDEELIADAYNVMRESAAAASYTSNLAGRAVQRAMEQADSTLIDNAARDPAHPKWARIPHAGACGWCVMIGSQGFVYSSDKTASRVRHANCRCATVVDFDTTNPNLEGYNESALYDQYSKAREAVEPTAWDEWQALTPKEQAKYGSKSRGGYDHFLRNKIVAEMNRAENVKKSNANKLTKAEYAKVTSAINTVYDTRFKGKTSGIFYHGDYGYRFNINEFNDYEITKKWEIE